MISFNTRTTTLTALAAAMLTTTMATIAVAPPEPLPQRIDLLEASAIATKNVDRKLLLDIDRAGSRLVAVGTFGIIAISDDEGKSWRQAIAPTSVMLTAVSFVNEKKGFAAGHDGVILATTDGGETWKRSFDGNRANQQVLAAAQKNLDAVKASARGPKAEEQILAADDLLASAEAAVKTGPSRAFLDIGFIDEQNGWAVGAFGQLFATTNGGGDWLFIGDRLTNPEGLHLNSITVGANGELLVGGEMGTVFRSADRGASWQRLETGYIGHIYGALRLPPVGSQPSSIFAYGFKGNAYRSIDNGRTWAKLTLPTTSTLVTAEYKSGRLQILADDGGVLISLNGGQSFQKVADKPVGAQRLTSYVALNQGIVAVGEAGVSLYPKLDK